MQGRATTSSRRRFRASQPGQRGVALVLIVIGLVVGVGALFVTGLLRSGESRLSRDQVTQNSLRQAKDALLAYAGSWPNRRGTDPLDSNNDVWGQQRPPGFLPCPDRDNSGAPPGQCGTAVGSSQSSRLGRLPFRTLGLPDIRDGYGERLWYAVSSKYKTSVPSYDLNPETGLGTISVRSATGMLIHDGTNTNLYNADAGGVVAVIIAPGPPIERWGDAGGISRVAQDRGCSGPGCNANGSCASPATSVPRCNPVNYLEKAWGLGGDEDNADFVDVNDDRSGNWNGFIAGPVTRADGSVAVNDQIIVITYAEIMQVIMQRVALEVVHCMSSYGLRNNGKYPYPAPVCRSGYSNALQWSDREEVLFGRVPDPVFDTTQARSPTTMESAFETYLAAPNQHQTQTTRGCTIDTSSPETSTRWWTAWKNHVFVAIAYSRRPDATLPLEPCTSHGCLQIVDAAGTVIAANKEFAVIVGGRPLQLSPTPQTRTGGSPAATRLVGNYLESSNSMLERLNDHSTIAECSDMTLPMRCDADPPTPFVAYPLCLAAHNRVTSAPSSATLNDVVVYHPK